jgi:hypothetical protein
MATSLSRKDIPIQIAQTAVTIATPIRPLDPDTIANAAAGMPGYDIISIFNEKEKISEKIWLVNDGPGTLFALCSADGELFTGEGDILIHEYRAFVAVYELRVRSPDATTKYRLSEFEPGIMA